MQKSGCVGCAYITEEPGKRKNEKVMFRCFAPGKHMGYCISYGFMPCVKPAWCKMKREVSVGRNGDRNM